MPVIAAAALSSLLVVAPSEWCAALAPFAEAKCTLPWVRSCRVISVEELGAGQSGDASERLKRGLFARWRAGGEAAFDSVLLVGDMHVMPTRYMMLDRATEAACDVAFYPSDLYFADLADDTGAFEDWNGRTDGIHARYIGEVHGESGKSGPIDADGCGLLPEIAVGRWPVATLDEAKGLAEKSLRHERAIAAARARGETKAPAVEVVACGEWIDNQARIGAVAERLRARFDVESLSYFAADEAGRPTAKRIREALVAGRSLVLHTGHGEPDGWHLGLRVEDVAATAGQAQSRLPVLFSIGCSTAVVAPQPPYEAYRDADGRDHPGTNAGEVFDAPPPPPACLQPRSFAHASIGARSVSMPDGGAIAYIGCVTGSQPCAHTLLDDFTGAVAEEPGGAIGESWRRAVAGYVAHEHLRELRPTQDWYPPSIYFQPMKFVLLGDPTVRLR